MEDWVWRPGENRNQRETPTRSSSKHKFLSDRLSEMRFRFGFRFQLAANISCAV